MKQTVHMIQDMDQLSLEEKIGQMFMIDFPGLEINPENRDLLEEIPWGSAVLFRKNVHSREQLTALNQSLFELNRKNPLIISVDQEGGIVNRADFDSMHLSPANTALGFLNSPESVERMSHISGMELRELGFHLNFAPVTDVNSNPENPIIGIRAYGDNPELVGRLAVSAVRGFQSAGIGACAKHFPGHGDTSVDSHLGLPVVNRSMEEIESMELPPFLETIKAGVETVMTAHILYPAMDDQWPATLSEKILTGLLRGKMGFDGLIITDSMAMKAIADRYGSAESAVQAVRAGVDIVMQLGDPANQVSAYNAVLKAVRKGVIDTGRINESIDRIMKFRNKYVKPPAKTAGPQEIDKRMRFTENLTRQTIRVIKGQERLPLKTDGILIISPDSIRRTALEESREHGGVYPHLIKSGISARQLKYSMKDTDIDREKLKLFTEETENLIKSGKYCCCIVELYARGRMKPETGDVWTNFINRLKKDGVDTILVYLLSPSGLPDNSDTIITGYDYSPLSMKYVAEKLISI